MYVRSRNDGLLFVVCRTVITENNLIFRCFWCRGYAILSRDPQRRGCYVASEIENRMFEPEYILIVVYVRVLIEAMHMRL